MDEFLDKTKLLMWLENARNGELNYASTVKPAIAVQHFARAAAFQIMFDMITDDSFDAQFDIPDKVN